MMITESVLLLSVEQDLGVLCHKAAQIACRVTGATSGKVFLTRDDDDKQVASKTGAEEADKVPNRKTNPFSPTQIHQNR